MKLYSDFDQGSFFLGMIEAFSEVVMQEVKNLALSPVMEALMWKKLQPDAENIFKKFGVSYYEETNLVSTDLAPDEAVKGKTVLLIYLNSHVLEGYKKIKKRVEMLEIKDLYDDRARKEASTELCRLLSYSEEAITERRTAAYKH